MFDPNSTVILATAGLTGLAMVTAAGLAGWRGWLTLKQQELALPARGPRHEDQGDTGNASARIEIADLKERIRKLEAIAAGVDL